MDSYLGVWLGPYKGWPYAVYREEKQDSVTALTCFILFF